MVTTLLIKENGKVRPYGSDEHDALQISPDGKCLYYRNLHCGEGSQYGDYRFVVDEEGNIPDNMEYDEVDNCFANIGGFDEIERQRRYAEKRKRIDELRKMMFGED